MKRRTGPPPIYLASSGTENMPAAHSEERLLSLLATLEECRAFLADKASPETGKLLSLAILELRMELNQVADLELKALCDVLTPVAGPLDTSHHPKSPQGQRRGALAVLKLVK